MECLFNVIADDLKKSLSIIEPRINQDSFIFKVEENKSICEFSASCYLEDTDIIKLIFNLFSKHDIDILEYSIRNITELKEFIESDFKDYNEITNFKFSIIYFEN